MSGLAVVVCDYHLESLTAPFALDGSESDDGSWLSPLIPRYDDETSPCWRFIDPYGHTYFNHLQLRVFIEELETIANQASRRQLGRLHEIRALAELALALPHRYLRFMGD